MGSDKLRRLVGWAAIIAPGLHSLTDVIEWVQGGFSPLQLALNYVAFLALTVLLLGLHAVQSGRAGWMSLLGALGYGFSFVYFAHTTLMALESGVPTYEDLWRHLGNAYTWQGALMVLGGVAFGIASLRARVLSRSGCALFLAGLVVNLIVALLPQPALVQTIGTLIRNGGLIVMGCDVLAQPRPLVRGR
ncbi:MAG: hypothetical protein AB7T63_00465 [Planctomycetota bacterium]